MKAQGAAPGAGYTGAAGSSTGDAAKNTTPGVAAHLPPPAPQGTRCAACRALLPPLYELVGHRVLLAVCSPCAERLRVDTAARLAIEDLENGFLKMALVPAAGTA